MKSITLLFFFASVFFISNTAHAQVVNIPDISKTSFSEKYPNATDVDWSNDVTAYKAKFTLDDKNYTAHYSIDGSWSYTENDLDLSEFPQEVQTSLKKSRFSDWKVLSSGYLENSKGQKLYRIQVKNGLEKQYVFYDSDGKEVKSNLTL